MSDKKFSFKCLSCGIKISVDGHDRIPYACPYCKCINWLSEDVIRKQGMESEWEQRRYELSKEFLLRVQFTPEVFDACLDSPNRADTVAQVAVMMADAMIKHLRKDETEQSD